MGKVISFSPEVETLAIDQPKPILAVASMGRKEKRSAVVFMVNEGGFAIA